MKTTIDIADDLLQRAQRTARKEKTTLRALAEEGLRMVLREKESRTRRWKWKPVTRGGGLNPEYKNWDWNTVRSLIYEAR